MAKTTSVEITSKFQVVGTVGKIESLETKGGGWQFKVIVNDEDAIDALKTARKKLCVFDVGVSANGDGGEDDNGQGELDIGDAVPEPNED